MDTRPPLTDAPDGVNWQDMRTAPRDGTIIAVKFYPWNDPNNTPAVQAAQWVGEAWRTPFEPESTAYASAWAPADEVTAALARKAKEMQS